MSAFARGFAVGGDMYQRGLDNKRRKEKDAMDAEAHRAAMDLMGLRTDALRREVATQNELRGLRTEMSDFLTGTDRAATNANLDADFEQAYQATGLGLPMPAMAGGSNAANQQALTVRRPVDMSSPEFQSGMAGLRSRYALASGNMADFDAVTNAERTRLTNAQDAEWAQAVVADPNGEQAVQARTYINNFSKSLGIDPPDPKTGMSTLRIIRGDRTKPIEIPPADLAKIAVGVRRLQRGDVGGLDVISAVNKDLAAAAAEEFNIDLSVAGKNNDTAYRATSLGLDRDRLNLQRRETDARIGAINRPNFQLIGTDDKGEPVWVDMSRLGAAPDGRMQLPAGVTPMRMPQTLSDAEKVAYNKALEVIAALPDNATPGDVADVFRRFGLDPAKFTGSPGAPATARFGGGTNPPPPPTPAPTPAPAPRPLTGFEQRRQQALEEEAARRAREREARQRESEAERLRRLEERPDLQGIGGLRYFQ